MRASLLLIVSFITTCVIAQSTEELDARGGFKDIRVATPVDSLNGHKLKKEFTEGDNVYPSAIYDFENPEYMTIGDIKVTSIQLETYRNIINKITVVTEKDERLMKAMEKVFGKATYNAKDHFYFWSGKEVILTFESHGKKELKLVYKSITVPKMMKEDKQKKVENISNDF